jgi:hypothetical protein
MKTAVVALLASASLFAAVDGVVTNQTTGKPQAGVEVTLVKLGQGMDTVGTVKSDAQGKFRFDKDLDAAAPYMLQALYEGVSYNKVVPPGAPSSGLGLDIYSVSSKVADATIAAHMILLQPTTEALGVNESIEYRNAGKVAFNDEKNGTLRFYLPPEAKGEVTVGITPPGGMPIQRPAEKTATANVYMVNYPVKPGDTRFDIAYSLPPTKEFTGKAISGEKIRVVVPKGVKIQGEGLTSLGTEPSTQAEIFDTPAKTWKVSIEGTGTLRGSADQQQNADAGGSEDTGPGIEEAKPRIYAKLPWMLGFASVIFILGFAILYRADPTVAATASPKKK